MKKLLLLCLVLLGEVMQMSATDQSIYLRCNLNINNKNGWNDRHSEYKFTYAGVNPDDDSEDVYTYTINSSSFSDDIYFRLWFDGYDYELTTNCYYHNDGFTFSFANGQWENYDVKLHWTEYKNEGQPSGWSSKSNSRVFTISQSSIKASEYKITLYCKNTYNSGDNIAIKVDIVSMPVTISSVGKGTFSCDRALNFNGISNINAYMITDASAGTLTLSDAMTKVPANTGLYLEGTEDTYNIPVITTDDASGVSTSGNMLVPGTGAAVAATAGSYTNFILTNKTTTNSNAPLKFYKANNNTVPVGKAYLQILTSSVGARDFFWFDNDATGIANVDVNANDNFDAAPIYNLAGQRVNKSYKGVVIVNGKKMLNK